MADATVTSAVDTFMQAANQAAMLAALNITLGGAFATSGAFSTTLTVTGNTNITLPTSGTLAILGANTFTSVQTFPNGAVGAPALNLGDATTGLYRSASNEISIAGAGTQRYKFESTGTLSLLGLGSNSKLNFQGTVATSSIASNGYGDGLTCSGSLSVVGIQCAGGSSILLRANGNLGLGSGSTLGWSSTSDGAGALVTTMASRANAWLGLGAVSATPIEQTLAGCDGSGSNITGGILNISAGRGTGTGIAGVLNFRSHAAAASSSTVNATPVTVMQITSSTLITISSGVSLRLGNAATTGLTAGADAALTNATIVLQDSTGQAYRIPCII